MTKLRKCLVLNSSYMATAIITSERGFVIHYKGNADVLATYEDDHFQTVDDQYPVPSIIRVPKWIELKYDKIPLTRENLFKRDNYRCVYCGISGRANLTMDHVVPKSKGGKDTWDNLVTACKMCNAEKDDMTCEEWGKPHPEPRRPHHLLLIKKNVLVIPEMWKPYLFLN